MSIHAIFPVSYNAQVVPLVIKTVAIDMINIFRRSCTHDQLVHAFIFSLFTRHRREHMFRIRYPERRGGVSFITSNSLVILVVNHRLIPFGQRYSLQSGSLSFFRLFTAGRCKLDLFPAHRASHEMLTFALVTPFVLARWSITLDVHNKNKKCENK